LSHGSSQAQRDAAGRLDGSTARARVPLQHQHTVMSWTITLTQVATPGGSRVHLRVRLGRVRHTRLVGLLGGFFGNLVIGLLAAGMLERVVTENLQ
jgi:hypothetical protein